MKEFEPTDFKEFYDRNEPDNAQALACLYRSVRDASDEDFFETKEVSEGKVTHHVIASVRRSINFDGQVSARRFLDFIEIAK